MPGADMEKRKTPGDSLGRLRALADSGASLAVILLACAVVYDIAARKVSSDRPPSLSAVDRRPAPVPEEPMSLDGAWVEGNRSAGLAIVEYADFQCPYCRLFANTTMLDLRKKSLDKGEVLFAFRHLPLTGIHPLAEKAARVAECAGRQGHFWEMHDWLFRDQRNLNDPLKPTVTGQIGLDRTKLASCVSSGSAGRIAQDAEEAKSLLVTGTPTFFVGIVRPDRRVKVIRRVSGAVGLKEFSETLDPLLRTTGG